MLTRILDSDEQGGVQEAPNGVFSSSFGRICNINTIYNIFPDGNSNPNPQNLSQADKYLTNMAVTDPTDTDFEYHNITRDEEGREEGRGGL